jgi:leader peptidase (prepilin peptidase)/N-methyltransferase
MLDLPAWFILSTLFILGSMVGSFLNVAVWRIPRHDDWIQSLKGVVYPPSACPGCRTPILSRDNVPILGWLLLRGRCRACGIRISWRYPAIEALNGILWVVLYLAIVPQGYFHEASASCIWTELLPGDATVVSREGIFTRALWHYVYFLVLIEGLLVATLIDFDLQIIPDGVTVPMAIFGLAMPIVTGMTALWPVWFHDPELIRTLGLFFPEGMLNWWETWSIPNWIAAWPRWHAIVFSLTGLVVGAGMIWLVRILGYWVFGQEAMGFGDVILGGVIGIYVGWQASIVVFFLAPVVALLSLAVTFPWIRNRAMPYGPYLSIATLIVILGWQPIMTRAEKFFAMGPLLFIIGAVMLVLLIASLWLVQGMKRLLGIRDEWPMEDEWTSADQLIFFANRQPEATMSQPGSNSTWNGELASQGRLHSEKWRGHTLPWKN